MAETFNVFIDARFNAAEREQIGRAIVDYIVGRTKRGKGVDNVPFRSRNGRSYTKAYQEHRDFEVAGKSNAPINLTLTGDMLSSIEVVDISIAGRVVIGITDNENADKARFMREKGYNFLGLSQNEQSNILARFAKVTPEEVRASQVSTSVARTFLRNLFNG